MGLFSKENKAGQVDLNNLPCHVAVIMAGNGASRDNHKAIATGAAHSDEESVQSAMQLVTEINEEVNRQLEERIRIYEQKILPALRQHHIIFYQSRNVEPFHKEFLRRFFREEIFPYLSPVPVSKDKVISFQRVIRLFVAVRLHC